MQSMSDQMSKSKKLTILQNKRVCKLAEIKSKQRNSLNKTNVSLRRDINGYIKIESKIFVW